jgi:tRNA A37 threonylcarbamoyladenosine biosynthesis protein TsaE
MRAILEEDMEDNIVIVEWSEKLPKKLTKEALVVEIKYIDEDTREIVVN